MLTGIIEQDAEIFGEIEAASSSCSRGDHYIVPVGEYPAIKVNIKTVQSAGYQPEATEEGFTI